MEIYKNVKSIEKVALLDQPIEDKCNYLKVNTEPDGEYYPTRVAINSCLSNVIDQYSDLVGFTLTFRKSFHSDDDLFLHRMISKKLIKSTVWKTKKYILFPEFTSKKGNLHYHGIMWDSYEIEVMRSMKWWRKNYGFVRVELKLNSPYNWLKYITKDYMKTGLYTLYNGIFDKDK